MINEEVLPEIDSEEDSLKSIMYDSVAVVGTCSEKFRRERLYFCWFPVIFDSFLCFYAFITGTGTTSFLEGLNAETPTLNTPMGGGTKDCSCKNWPTNAAAAAAAEST